MDCLQWGGLYQYIPTPKTIFKDTYKLIPGHYLIYHGENLIIKSFSELPEMLSDRESLSSDEQEGVAELDGLLSKVVSDHMVSDVPFGALPSGGIDSSVVAVMMQKAGSSPIRTFTMGFKEEAYNEAPFASKVANFPDKWQKLISLMGNTQVQELYRMTMCL